MARKTRKKTSSRKWNRVYSRSHDRRRRDRRKRVDRVSLIFDGKMSQGLRVLRTLDDRVIIGIGNASIEYAGAVNALRPWFGISDEDRDLFREDARREIRRMIREGILKGRSRKTLISKDDLEAIGVTMVSIIFNRAFQKGHGLDDKPHKTYRQLESQGKVGR